MTFEAIDKEDVNSFSKHSSEASVRPDVAALSRESFLAAEVFQSIEFENVFPADLYFSLRQFSV